MDVALGQALLTPHNLIAEKLGSARFSPEDLTTLSTLDPITTTVIAILNEGHWLSVTDAMDAGIELPPNAFLVVRKTREPLRGGGVSFYHSFMVLDSSARRAVDALAGLTKNAQCEVGLATADGKDGLSYRYSFTYRTADSFAELAEP